MTNETLEAEALSLQWFTVGQLNTLLEISSFIETLFPLFLSLAQVSFPKFVYSLGYRTEVKG